MTNEAECGANTDNRVILAVAAIKADVLRFGLGDREPYATWRGPRFRLKEE